MGKLVITIELGGDAGRLRRASEEIKGLIDEAGYLVTGFDIIEEDNEDE